MSEFTNRIDTLLTNTHQKRSDLCRGTEIPESTVRNWIKGKTPSIEAAIKIAEYFDCSLDWLLTGKQETENKEIIKKKPLSDDEEDLINYFRLLDERDRDYLLLTARTLCSRAKEEARMVAEKRPKYGM